MSGEDWALVVLSVTDGDTLRGRIERVASLTHGFEQAIRSSDPKGQRLRLVNLNTPEAGKAGWAEAKTDAWDWVFGERRHQLRVQTYGDTLGRLLADVYVDGDRSNTLTAHMLELGWEPYLTLEQRAVPRGY